MPSHLSFLRGENCDIMQVKQSADGDRTPCGQILIEPLTAAFAVYERKKMHIPPIVFPLVVSIGVYIDAKVIGIKKGQLTGFFNMGSGMWAFACFLFLVIALPAYLFKRGEYKQINAQLKAQSLLPHQDQALPGQVWPPPPEPPTPV